MDDDTTLADALTRLSEALYAVQSWLDDMDPVLANRWAHKVVDTVENLVETEPILRAAADPDLFDLEV